MPDSDELAALEDKRDWFGILLRTSTPDLRPKDPSIAYFHWSALYGLSMDDWIIPDARVTLSDDQKFDVDMWTDSRETLARWRKDGPGTEKNC